MSEGDLFFDTEDNPRWGRIISAIIGACVLVIVGFLLVVAAFQVYGRWNDRQEREQGRNQALKDAQNKVKVSNIEIRNQKQRIQITKQQARIRYEKSVGIREAQDEIAKTLTPLYVQFEMTDALKEIAKSGRNSSVVYLPSGANGIPLVSTVDPTQVQRP